MHVVMEEAKLVVLFELVHLLTGDSGFDIIACSFEIHRQRYAKIDVFRLGKSHTRCRLNGDGSLKTGLVLPSKPRHHLYTILDWLAIRH